MNDKSRQHELILASTSPYRKLLLQRLGLEFRCVSPEVDEIPLQNESVPALTTRLAHAKAASVSGDFPSALVIGSDQLATFCGGIVGKPGSVEKAVEQLMSFSGQTVNFLSAVCILRLEPAFSAAFTVPTRVNFRTFSAAEADRYVQLDMPLDCSGSFKSESAGALLLESLESTDPSALIGLPLIQLSHHLRMAGLQLP